MKKTLIAAVAALCIASVVSAQTYPHNGYIGVFTDATATNCCITAPAFALTTMSVVAVIGGDDAGGISGAEFRLEFTAPTGWNFSFQANPAANLVLGNPVDLTPGEADPNSMADDAGLNLAFMLCQPSDHTPAAGDKVVLGTIQAINLGGGPCDILTKRKEPASNANFKCPLFTICDDPVFTKVCTTIVQEQTPGQLEPIGFRSRLNLTGCTGTPDTPTSCQFVAVSHPSWSGVKALFR